MSEQFDKDLRNRVSELLQNSLRSPDHSQYSVIFQGSLVLIIQATSS
jgi:hypothetical protein